jgi:D-beta-D-heptose 7-phosphate kinase/D-beta-D-heptose 1-phosphate adenosyltransferase
MRQNIAVVGDIGLDIYEYGMCHRISPEAPIAVLKDNLDSPIVRGAMAANLAWQFKFLPVNTTLYGFCDQSCLDIISKFGYHTDIIIAGNAPRKIRFYSGNAHEHERDFQLLRWDKEYDDCNVENIQEIRKQVFERIESNIHNIDVLVISNYSKGLLDQELSRNLIQLARNNNVISVVDPKHNAHWWYGCDYLKPNLSEATAWKPELKKQPIELAKWIKEELHIKSVLITEAGEGVSFCTENSMGSYRPKRKVKDVNSLIGAGDCFIAYFSYYLGIEKNIDKAIELAFHAGAAYVRAKHNKPVSLYEAKRRIDHQDAKIVSAEEMKFIKDNVYPEQSFVLANGCFDGGLTIGHIKCLQYAKSEGEKLIVAINDDTSVKSLKGNDRPFVPIHERMQIVSCLEFVDFVVSFSEDTPFNLIKSLGKLKVVKGGDYKPENVAGYGLDGVEIKIFPIQPCLSTTDKSKIRGWRNLFGRKK